MLKDLHEGLYDRYLWQNVKFKSFPFYYCRGAEQSALIVYSLVHLI